MSLSKRLENIQTGAYADPVQEFMKLPWDEMCNAKIDFGKAHAGKSYLTAWHTEPAWVRWVVKTYEGSGKSEHIKFLKFVEAMIEMEEKGMTPTTLEEMEGFQGCQGPVMPLRAKAKAMPTQPAKDLMVHLGEETQSEGWINMHSDISTEENIEALQARMNHMEAAMMEILNHVRRDQQ